MHFTWGSIKYAGEICFPYFRRAMFENPLLRLLVSQCMQEGWGEKRTKKIKPKNEQNNKG